MSGFGNSTGILPNHSIRHHQELYAEVHELADRVAETTPGELPEAFSFRGRGVAVLEWDKVTRAYNTEDTLYILEQIQADLLTKYNPN